jgi:hypothetical protein
MAGLGDRMGVSGRTVSIEVHSSGDPVAVRWVTVAEADSLELLDPVSGRSIVVVRPAEDMLAMEDLVWLEQLVFAWANLLTQRDADRELAALVKAEPLAVLTGLSWILAVWCVLTEVRTGTSADDVARALDYQGPWRRAETADEELMWTALNQRVRIGVLAALTEDERAIAAYKQVVTVPSNAAPVLLRHTLVTMDGFSQDMLRNGVNAKGLIASFAERTGITIRPRRCFNRAR